MTILRNRDILNAPLAIYFFQALAFWGITWATLCASLSNAVGIFNLGLDCHRALPHYFCDSWGNMDGNISLKGANLCFYTSRASPNMGVAVCAIELNGVAGNDYQMVIWNWAPANITCLHQGFPSEFYWRTQQGNLLRGRRKQDEQYWRNHSN